jgi:hypothetical protein
MTTAIGTLRTTLATALANPTIWQTFAFPPATILANSVNVVPADPYMEPMNGNADVSAQANFRILIAVANFDNLGSLEALESMAIAVRTKLLASGINMIIRSLSAPATLTVQSGDLLACDYTISLLTEWT